MVDLSVVDAQLLKRLVNVGMLYISFIEMQVEFNAFASNIPQEHLSADAQCHLTEGVDLMSCQMIAKVGCTVLSEKSDALF